MLVAFWFDGIHWEKEWMLEVLSLAVLAGSLAVYLKERSPGKLSIPGSMYLLLVAIYLATLALAFKISEIYDRMWYIYKDR